MPFGKILLLSVKRKIGGFGFIFGPPMRNCTLSAESKRQDFKTGSSCGKNVNIRYDYIIIINKRIIFIFLGIIFYFLFLKN